MAYNPYNDIQAIYENKKKYNEAKTGGQNFSAYADAAKQYYTNLSNNGYADVAEQLNRSTEEQAADLMRQYTNINAKPTGAAPVFNGANQNAATSSGITPEIAGWISNIVGAKGQYNEALATGSGAEGNIAASAQDYYKLLTGAGRNDISDLLASSDYTSALNYLNSIGNTKSASSPDAQAALAQINQLIGDGGVSPNAQASLAQINQLIGSGGGSPNTQALLSQINQLIGSGPPQIDYDKINQNTQGTLNYLNTLLQPSAQDLSAQTQTQGNLQTLFNTFLGNNEQTNAQSQDVLDQISKYAADQAGRYDNFYNYQKDTNPFDTDTARAIMNYYNMRGDNASGDAVASGGGDNAGNIDSYAAANANRQQLAFTNAGTNAVNQNYNDKVASMLATLQSLGVDVGDAQNRQLGLVQGNQAYNADLLGNYTTGTGDLNSNITARQTARGNNLTDAFAQLTGLYQTDATNASNDYAAKLQAALGAHQTDATSASNDYAARLQAALGAHQTDAGNASNDYAAKLQAALNAYNIGAGSDTAREANTTNIALQNLLNQQSREGLASNEKIAASSNEQARYLAELEVERDKYIAQGDWNKAIEVQRLMNQGSAAVAGSNAAASRYDADTSYKIAQLQAEAEKAANSAGAAQPGVQDVTISDFTKLFNAELSERLSAVGPTPGGEASRKSTAIKEAWLAVESEAKRLDNAFKTQYGYSTDYYSKLAQAAKEQYEEDELTKSQSGGKK